MKNELTTQNKSLKTLLDSDITKDKFREVLGKKAPAFVASLLSLSSTDLEGVDPRSVLSAAMTAATLDLPINPNLGFAYIIPYKGQAQFQMGYKGFIQLAMRSGMYKTINVTDIKEGELKSFDRLSGDMQFSWIENPKEREKTETIGYIAYYKLLNGFEKTHYMTTDELKNHGTKFSQTMKKGYGLWVDSFDAMARKTVIKLLLSKFAPLSTQMQKAILADQAIITDDDQYKYVDNDKETPEEVAAEKERERIIKHIAESKTIEELELCEEAIDDAETRELFKAKKKELSI